MNIFWNFQLEKSNGKLIDAAFLEWLFNKNLS